VEVVDLLVVPGVALRLAIEVQGHLLVAIEVVVVEIKENLLMKG
jgi:hypothetical protein